MNLRNLQRDDFKLVLTNWKNETAASIALLFHDGGYRFTILKLQGHVLKDAISGDIELGGKLLIQLARAGRLFGEPVKDKAQLPASGKPVTGHVLGYATRDSRNLLDESIVTAFVDEWNRLALLGRAKPPRKVENAVFARAGGCCEFRGCGRVLYEKNAQPGNYGYFAHIVGAELKGPRGDYPLPQSDRNIADNLLFLCDEDHRLIDRVSPDEYSVEILREMRVESQVDRDNYALFRQFQQADVVTVLSDIMGVTTDVERYQVFEALTGRQLRPTERSFRSIMRDTAGGRDASVKTYWGNFIQTYANDIRNLIGALRGDGAVGPRGVKLALFPLGNMPALVLAGRLIGEARPFEIFHFNRTLNSWAWPSTPQSPNFPTTSYSLGDHRGPQDAIVLCLEITAQLAEENLPEHIRTLPRISITTERRDQNPFTSPDELTRLRDEIQKAINLAQDHLKVSIIHVLTLAPAACVLALGMKLQPRMHREIHIYQMPRGQPYFHALTIAENQLTAPESGETLKLD